MLTFVDLAALNVKSCLLKHPIVIIFHYLLTFCNVVFLTTLFWEYLKKGIIFQKHFAHTKLDIYVLIREHV